MSVFDNISTTAGSSFDLGARRTGDGISFTTVVPKGSEIKLILRSDKDHKDIVKIPLEKRIGRCASVTVKGIGTTDFSYIYETDEKLISDPYAFELKDGYARVVDQDDDWDEKAPDISPEDIIIYKAHVRGFTKGKGSGASKGGTFAGFAEKIPYLSALGVNAVEWMPAYEWDPALSLPPFMKITGNGKDREATIRNFWGYSAVNTYTAPNASFAGTDSPSGEVRNTVAALHRAGMLCFAEFYFPGGTDPFTAVNAVLAWKLMYHMDGFHFVGDGVPVGSIVSHPLLADTYLLFDRPTGELCAGGNKKIISCQDRYLHIARRFLKGDEGMTRDMAFALRANPSDAGVVNYISAVNGFTLFDMVSYDWKHNEDNGEDNRDGTNENDSWNCGQEGQTRKRSVIALRYRQMRNALSYVFLSQGIPMLRAGDEMGNSQNGNNNAYASDNETGWVSWSRSRDNETFREFVRKLIAFRKAHPVLHMSSECRGTDRLGGGYPDISFHDESAWFCSFENTARSFGVLYDGHYAGSDEFLYLLFNSSWEQHAFAVPKLPKGYVWKKEMDTSTDEGFLEEPLRIPDDGEKRFVSPARSVVILTGRPEKTDVTEKISSRPEEGPGDVCPEEKDDK